jgi:hypothetical protein
MANINNMQPVLLNNIVETNQSEIGVITHQPPPSYDQTKIQTEQVFHQNPTGPVYVQPNGQVFHHNPTGPVYVQSNGQIVAVPNVANGTYGLYAVRRTTDAKDYLNIVWSVINTCCCLWPLGLIALVVSIVTVRKRHRGDDEGARCTGISAVVINILATIGGILLIIFYFAPRLNS